MLKAKKLLRPDRDLEKNLISLVYVVVAMVFCLLLLFVFPEHSLLLLIGTLLMSVLSIILTIGVLNASEAALTYGGFANEILNSATIIKRIDNNIGESVIENKPAKQFFAEQNVMKLLKAKLFDDRQNLIEFHRLELALKSLKKESVTLNLIGDDGETWFHVSVRPLYLKKNDIFEEEFSIRKIQSETYFLWQLEDVTASKNMEKIFEEERKKLHHFIDLLPVGIYIADSSFKIEYVNDTFAAQLAEDKEKLLSRSLSEIVIDKQELLDPKLPAYTGMIHFIDGHLENTQMFTQQTTFQDGPDIKIYGLTVQNLPTDKTLRHDLNYMSDEIDGLIDFSPHGVIFIDSKSVIQRVNRRALEMTSWKDPQEKPHKLSDLFDKEAVTLLKRILDDSAQAKTENQKLEIRLKTDKTVRIDTAPRWHIHQKNKTFEGLILYLEDTTAQKSLELKFAQAQKMQAMGQLAGGIAHDFNNLLTAMIGFCDLLLQRHGIGDPSFTDLIQIKQNANRAAGLVRQLLAFSRQQPLKPKRIDVTENFMELSHLMQRILGEQIELEFNHGNDLGYIKVDPVQFSQVIINLAVNAKDAMNGKGKLSISTRTEKIETSYTFGEDLIAPGDFVVISVSDTGCGIPHENLNRIFEPFFSTKQNVVGSGTGLGLAMVYGIVRQTEGFIKVDSMVGKGTTFSIYLPRFETAEEDQIPLTENKTQTPLLTSAAGQNQKLILGLNVSKVDHQPQSYKNPQNIRILFVEDEDSVRTVGVRALKKKGFTVQACSSAENALALLDTGETFEMLITDMVMPGMSGTELAQTIKQRLPNIKIILASGYSEEIARRELKGSDDFEFIAKPYSLGDLTKKVSEIIDGMES
jgi:two-component system cell cycle sensor histidine kinase/response regulator CckA